MILDLHCHSDASDDSRAPLDSDLRWLVRKRDVLPIDGNVVECDLLLEDEWGDRLV